MEGRRNRSGARGSVVVVTLAQALRMLDEALTEMEQRKEHEEHADADEDEGHHADSTGKDLPFSSAMARTASRRQRGMELEDFQLDTVEGVRLSAEATDTVPPSASMISDTVCIHDVLR